MLTIVGTGVDTLAFTLPGHPTAKWVVWAEELRKQACADGAETPTVIEAGESGRELPDPLVVLPHGARSGHRWLFAGELYALGVSDAAHLDRAAVRCELTAELLWTLGPEVAAARALAAIAALLDRVATPEFAKPSRVDLAMDFQGWHPQAIQQRMVTRATQRRFWLKALERCGDCGKHWSDDSEAYHCIKCGGRKRVAGPWAEPPPQAWGELEAEHYFSGLSYSGARWGSGRTLLVRLYDKSRELTEKSQSKKAWLEPIWTQHGAYDPTLPVWRLEPQVRRRLLRELRIGPDKEEITSLADLFRLLESLHLYLVGGFPASCPKCGVDAGGRVDCESCGPLPQSDGWISLRTPTEDSNRSRWPVAGLWEKFQRCRFGADGDTACRERRVELDSRRAALMLTGCSARIAADLGMRKRFPLLSTRELFNRACEAAAALLDDEEFDFEDRVAEHTSRRAKLGSTQPKALPASSLPEDQAPRREGALTGRS